MPPMDYHSTHQKRGFFVVDLGFSNLTERLTGVQIAALACSEKSDGLQIGAATGAGKMRGVQFGVTNVAETLKGIQIGFANDALNELHGLQVGFYCSAADGKYLQLGLVTRRKQKEGENKPWYKRVSPLIGF